MEIIKEVSFLRKKIKYLQDQKQSIGFVPTMGSLHDGHISLINKSKIENKITICSIYINPTQFNSESDLKKYPKTLEEDLAKLKKNICDIVFLPNDYEMYGANIHSHNYKIGNVLNTFEGQKRPGHFLGVLTIVSKLFKMVQPNVANFGEKDFQQLWIIKKYVVSENLDLKIRFCKTIRDKFGLALSSRNQHLSKIEMIAAQNLFASLNKFRNYVYAHFSDNQTSFLNKEECERIKNKCTSFLMENKLIKLDYFDVIEVENFSFATTIVQNNSYRILVAAYVGNTRLIDNILI